MPFLEIDGGPLRGIDLRQLVSDDGLDGRLFQVQRGFLYRDGEQTFAVIPHDVTRPARRYSDGAWHTVNGTDLASVPSVYWSYIAPHGRQSAAAILHDQQTGELDALPREQRIAARRPVDRRFQRALRDCGVPRMRARLMWAFVSLQSYFEPAPWTARAIIAGTGLAALAAWASVALAVLVSPWWLLLGLAPVVPVLVGWRVRRMLRTLALTVVFLGGVMLGQLALVGVFRLVELVASLWDERRAPVTTPMLDEHRIR